jgi:hypothetical protein
LLPYPSIFRRWIDPFSDRLLWLQIVANPIIDQVVCAILRHEALLGFFNVQLFAPVSPGSL